MIVWIFVAIFVVSGLLALFSLRDLKVPKKLSKIKRLEKRGMFGVINLR